MSKKKFIAESKIKKDSGITPTKYQALKRQLEELIDLIQSIRITIEEICQ